MLFSSSEKSEFLSLPILPSLVTLSLASPTEEAGGPVLPEELKKLEMIPQSTVRGVKRSHTRDMRSPPWEETVVLGRTITVQEGAIWSSFREVALSSVSRLRRGKVVVREKAERLVSVLTKV